MRWRCGWSCVAALGALGCLLTFRLEAQQPEAGSVPLTGFCARDATAGSPIERTLLILLATRDTNYSTLLRPLLVDEPHADTVAGIVPEGRCESLWSTVSGRAWYNTSYARPDRDGAVWQGRGLTVSLTGGAEWQRGLLQVALRPLVFASENRSFRPVGFPAPPADDFRDPAIGTTIDLPYRFGRGTYATVDPGESYVRARYRRSTIGVTTESQHWGPGYFYPLLIGTDGRGVPRAYVETRDANIWIGRATAHWEVGLLEASPFTKLEPGNRSRVASAAIGTFSPAGLRGLEIGGARYFHVRREPGSLSWSTATLPFGGLLKNQSSDDVVGGFNQLASVFFRVAPVGTGIEVYGELLRDDHNVNLRDLFGEPDHESAYMLGLRRVWKRKNEVRALTAEHANGRISHLARVRGQNAMYVHVPVVEGHTYRGQHLGSLSLAGGGGTAVSFSTIVAARSRDFIAEIRPSAQNMEGGTWDGRKRGHYVLGVSETRLLRGEPYGVLLAIEIGYGPTKKNNVTIGVHRSQ